MRMGLAQMLVEPGAKDNNLARAEMFIERAAAQGADVVVLPEAMTLGWTDPSARNLADEIPGGESFSRLQTAASRHGVYVCAGLVERAGAELFNTAVLLDPSGDLRLHHRKIHELDFARELYACGDRLRVAETPFGRIGLMICADAFAPGQVLSRSLGLMGANMILSPCAWAVPPDHDNEQTPYGQLWLDHYGPLAREFSLTIAGVSNVGPITAGPWQGRRCIGNSLVVGPDGRVAVRGPHGERAEMLLWHETPSAG